MFDWAPPTMMSVHPYIPLPPSLILPQQFLLLLYKSPFVRWLQTQDDPRITSFLSPWEDLDYNSERTITTSEFGEESEDGKHAKNRGGRIGANCEESE
jgi:hypothetical protein